jgi:hypothetical protein
MLRSRVVRPDILVGSGEARPSKSPPQYKPRSGGIFYVQYVELSQNMPPLRGLLKISILIHRASPDATNMSGLTTLLRNIS